MFTIHFILQVYYGWRKVVIEFSKRLDPELPFYYYTSGHSRFLLILQTKQEGELPSSTQSALSLLCVLVDGRASSSQGDIQRPDNICLI